MRKVKDGFELVAVLMLVKRQVNNNNVGRHLDPSRRRAEKEGSLYGTAALLSDTLRLDQRADEKYELRQEAFCSVLLPVAASERRGKISSSREQIFKVA